MSKQLSHQVAQIVGALRELASGIAPQIPEALETDDLVTAYHYQPIQHWLEASVGFLHTLIANLGFTASIKPPKPYSSTDFYHRYLGALKAWFGVTEKVIKQQNEARNRPAPLTVEQLTEIVNRFQEVVDAVPLGLTDKSDEAVADWLTLCARFIENCATELKVPSPVPIPADTAVTDEYLGGFDVWIEALADAVANTQQSKAA